MPSESEKPREATNTRVAGKPCVAEKLSEAEKPSTAEKASVAEKPSEAEKLRKAEKPSVAEEETVPSEMGDLLADWEVSRYTRQYIILI